MSEINAAERPAQTLNPQALRPADAARVLSAAGGKPITVEMLQECIDAGAPANSDGSVNLLFLAAWLVKEMGYGD